MTPSNAWDLMSHQEASGKWPRRLRPGVRCLQTAQHVHPHANSAITRETPLSSWRARRHVRVAPCCAQQTTRHATIARGITREEVNSWTQRMSLYDQRPPAAKTGFKADGMSFWTTWPFSFPLLLPGYLVTGSLVWKQGVASHAQCVATSLFDSRAWCIWGLHGHGRWDPCGWPPSTATDQALFSAMDPAKMLRLPAPVVPCPERVRAPVVQDMENGS